MHGTASLTNTAEYSVKETYTERERENKPVYHRDMWRWGARAKLGTL